MNTPAAGTPAAGTPAAGTPAAGTPAAGTPGWGEGSNFSLRVERFDKTVDDFFDAHLRGRPGLDRVMYAASALGDHSAIWLALAAVQGLRSGQGWRPLLRAGGTPGSGIGPGQRAGQVGLPAPTTRDHRGAAIAASYAAHQQFSERPCQRRFLCGRPVT